jgi:hypothetical protein
METHTLVSPHSKVVDIQPPGLRGFAEIPPRQAGMYLARFLHPRLHPSMNYQGKGHPRSCQHRHRHLTTGTVDQSSKLDRC